MQEINGICGVTVLFQQHLPLFDRAIVVLPAPSDHLADLKSLASEV